MSVFPLPPSISKYTRLANDLTTTVPSSIISESARVEEVLINTDFCSGFPVMLKKVIASYFSVFPAFVDLSHGSTLKELIDPEYHDLSHFITPLRIAKKIYQMTRPITNPTFGHLFPVDNEIQAYIMKLLLSQPGMCVCEIACASGEAGVLYAYAGAKQVVFNDIEPKEIALLRKNLAALPEKIQKKCDVVEGSCFDLLDKRPRLKKNVDVFVCRNFMHFLRPLEQKNLLAIVKKMLKPGGQAIFTTNSIYQHQNLPVDSQNEDEQAPSSFHMQSCILETTNNPSVGLFKQQIYCGEDEVSPSRYQQHYLYRKDEESQGKWRPLETSKKVDIEFRKNVNNTIQNEDVRAYLKKIPKGLIKATSAYLRLYNVNNLSRLFKDNGFVVKETFILHGLGHMLSDFSKRFEQGGQEGILVEIA